MMEEEGNIKQYTEEGADTTQDMMSLKRMLSKEQWVTEAKQIPLETLDTDETNTLLKCINQQELTDEEINKLEKILGKYRQSIRTQKPDETLEAVKQNIQHIKDCDTLLEELEKVRNEEIITIPMKIPKKDGVISVEIDVYPITDSTILFDPNSHFAPFMDQTEEIIQPTIADGTIEDKQVQQDIIQKSQKIIEEETDNYELIIELLSKQTTLHNQPRNPQKMEAIYRAMPKIYLAALITKVQPLIIEPVYNVDMDQVFQETSH